MAQLSAHGAVYWIHKPTFALADSGFVSTVEELTSMILLRCGKHLTVTKMVG